MKSKRLLSLLAKLIAVGFFFYLYIFLYWPISDGSPLSHNFLILNQPDEVANYFFIRELVLHGRFSYPEALSQLILNQLHPRSMTVVFGNLVPIGFPGIIVVYGALLKILVRFFGSQSFNWLAVVLTPLVAISVVGFFYGFLKKIFSSQVAAISAGLLLISPQWWYYASRPFQHNTLFVFFFLSFLYFFSRQLSKAGSGVSFSGTARSRSSGAHFAQKGPAPARPVADATLGLARLASLGTEPARPADVPRKDDTLRRLLTVFASALCFGLAVFVRPSELIWLSILLIFFLMISWRRWGWREFAALLAGLTLTAILFFSTQIAVYGAPWGSGYVKPLDSGSAGELINGPQGIPFLQAVFLPFGFHPLTILKNLKSYFFDLWPWWSLATLIGLILFLSDQRRRPKLAEIIYLAGLVCLTAYLLIFYGSWSFFDNILGVPSIASSHVRYFLPVYVLSLPLVARLLAKLWQGNYFLKTGAGIIILILALDSFSAVYLSFDGLFKVKENVAKYYQWQAEIYKLVPSDGVILTRYADKYLWPGRRVIAGWQRPEQLQAAANLAEHKFPVYLYDLILTKEEEVGLSARLAKLNLKLGPPLLKLENLELRQIINR